MKTVFVIGAGASQEVNLPTGAELKKVIADSLQENSRGGQSAIWEAFKFLSDHSDHGSYKFEQFAAASKHIREAMPQAVSIDNFLNAHPDDKLMALCGKCAIVQAILQAEFNSLIFVGSKNQDKLEFSWVEKHGSITLCNGSRIADRWI